MLLMRSLVFIIITFVVNGDNSVDKFMSKEERVQLREEARQMFYHGYRAYMENAYPADELMPLSCKGRFKGITPSRGDMDDALGNFSLTLVDSLDTLVVLGDITEFSSALKLVINSINFDQDIVVSVFETNIRMLGGLLSAHVLAAALKLEVLTLRWYDDELLKLAEDLGKRLLPAFNTSTGIPHSKVNLRHGVRWLFNSRETCTACAGTMILEMAALSRLTGNPVYELKAHKAMDALWKIRHHSTDLMGTVINIHSGDWVRKDSGIGAGIDSYYEYCLKAYIMLGDERYLIRFNRHYNAVMKYISRGPLLLDVHMHRPHLQSKNFMDALLAFWPGLQVLSGDVKPAIETHEMLYQVMKKHTLLPEAFTSDFQVHWGQHPLRPEFLESTYFLHRATNDDHYLYVGKAVLKALQRYAKVPCGYAAVNDVRTRIHEDRMDSFVLAETFKYLYMLFSKDDALPINLNEYLLTTEAHFLPLNLARMGNQTFLSMDDATEGEGIYINTCPNPHSLQTEEVRRPLREMMGSVHGRKLLPKFFIPSDTRQIAALTEMGISVVTMPDGRIQLLYSTATAKTPQDAAEGLTFMREMSKRSEFNENEGLTIVGVRVGNLVIPGGPGNFGVELTKDRTVTGKIIKADPIIACKHISNADEVVNKVVVALRGQCTFAQKVRRLKAAGAKAVIIIDNIPNTTEKELPLFGMSGDGNDDVDIPSIFLYSIEAKQLTDAMENNSDLTVTLGELNYLKANHDKTCSMPESKEEDHESAWKATMQTVLEQFLKQNEYQAGANNEKRLLKQLDDLSEKDGEKHKPDNAEL